MSSTALFCKKLLSDTNWLSDVRLRIRDDGMVESMEHGVEEPSDTLISGPVIPGMPNCHSHAFQRQMAGLAGFPGEESNDSFWSWRETMYRLANRVNADQIEAIAYWLYVEMLEAGYTSCAEFHYLHHDCDGSPYPYIDELGNRLLNAASRAGIALTLVPVLYCRSGFGQDTVTARQRRFANDPDQFMSIFENNLDRIANHPLHVVGLGLHSLRAVSMVQMKQVLEAENERAAAIHIHIAEQPAEIQQCLETHGKRPVEWLFDNAHVDHRWCLVHATHMQETEYELVAGSGAVVGLCPTTEADLGDGFFEGERFLDLGGRMAIGSDSNLRISPAEELRLFESGMRLRTGRRNVMIGNGLGCGRSLYTMAVAGGAAALGQPIGSISAGNRADLVELDPAHPMLCGVRDEDILERYVFAGEKGMIRSVRVAGQVRVQNGVHANRDEAAAGFSVVMEELSQ